MYSTHRERRELSCWNVFISICLIRLCCRPLPSQNKKTLLPQHTCTCRARHTCICRHHTWWAWTCSKESKTWTLMDCYSNDHNLSNLFYCRGFWGALHRYVLVLKELTSPVERRSGKSSAVLRWRYETARCKTHRD